MFQKLFNRFWMSYPISWVRCQLLTFELNCQKYQYLCHKYNYTWRNERAIEVPVVWKAVTEAQGKRVLELGNVLSHYFPINHDVLDKYEVADGVINKDIVGFSPKHTYDLIVSISTLEHVGWDETPKDKNKTKRALKSIRSLLAKKGKAIITFPMGYNKDLDVLFKSEQLKFDATYFLQRISHDNRWAEVDAKAIKNAKYGKPFSNANVVVVGILLG